MPSIIPVKNYNMPVNIVSKNSQDQISRLEDKESDMKKEYSKLHERYTELFKSHMDYMERSKAMMGSERLEQMQNMGAARNRIGGMSLNQLNRYFYLQCKFSTL